MFVIFLATNEPNLALKNESFPGKDIKKRLAEPTILWLLQSSPIPITQADISYSELA